MTQAQSTFAASAETAHAQAVDWITRVANTTPAWPSTWRDYAYSLASYAYSKASPVRPERDAAVAYFSTLSGAWSAGGLRGGSSLHGWDKLGTTWSGGKETATKGQASDTASSIVGQAQGFAAGVAADLGAGATWWGKYGLWVIGGGAALALGIYAYSAGKR